MTDFEMKKSVQLKSVGLLHFQNTAKDYFEPSMLISKPIISVCTEFELILQIKLIYGACNWACRGGSS